MERVAMEELLAIKTEICQIEVEMKTLQQEQHKGEEQQ